MTRERRHMYSGSHTPPPQTTPESGNLRPWKEVKNLPVSPDFSVRTRQQREAASSKVVSRSRHRSTTASVSRPTYFADAELAPLPVGLALFEEGARAFLEVLAQVAGEQQVLEAARGVGGDHPPHRFLRRRQRQRRQLRDVRCQLLDAAAQRRRRMHLVHEPHRLGV